VSQMSTALITPGSVSVIVVSWNARELLRGCLASLRQAQPACLLETIVVDNDSHDGSAEMVESEFPDARVIRSGKNLGFAGGNNLGIAAAQGDTFALVNSDALVHPGCLETLLAFLQSTPTAGLVGPKVFGADGLLQRNSRHLPSFWNTLCRALAVDRLFPGQSLLSGYEVPVAQHARTHRAQVLSGCFWLARREAVEQVGLLDDRFFFYGEDIDWCKRFSDAGWSMYFVPDATATHLGGGSSSGAPLRFSIEMLRATLKYWRKHHGAIGESTSRVLLILHHSLRLASRSLVARITRPVSPHAQHKRAEDAACLMWLLQADPAPESTPNLDAKARHN
jgi:GT2 family glycosyltransferase